MYSYRSFPLAMGREESSRRRRRNDAGARNPLNQIIYYFFIFTISLSYLGLSPSTPPLLFDYSVYS